MLSNADPIAESSWRDLYGRLVPARLFEGLVADGRSFVVVTGCQRSGTSWMRKILAETLPGAVAPKELDACRFLVDGCPLPVGDGTLVVLQTTFANVYSSSYARLPRDVPVLLMMRNPYSVCRSLVYNWDALRVEWSHRSGDPAAGDALDTDESRWQAAISIYVQSMHAGLEIIEQRPERTRVVVYDDFVHDVHAGLAALGVFLDRLVVTRVRAARVDLAATKKQFSLPEDFRTRVSQHCVAPFEELIHRARELGCTIGASTRQASEHTSDVGTGSPSTRHA